MLRFFLSSLFILLIILVPVIASYGSGSYGSGTYGSSSLLLVLNSTFGTNLTTENLTVYPTAVGSWENKPYTNITDWKLNGRSIALLNMPFEANLTAAENTRVKDYSDFQNHGTASGVLFNATGGHDGFGAFVFDGNDDLIDLPYNVTYNDSDFSFSAWIKMNGTLGGSPAVVIGSFRTSPITYMGVTTAGQLYSRINFNSTFNIDKTTTAGLNDNSWHHIAVTFDRDGNMVQYVDGVNVSSTNISTLDGLGLHPTSSLNSVKIGAGNSAGNPLNEFNGTIDEVMIWNRSLSSVRVWTLYTNQTTVVTANETNLGEVWKACVTPANESYELVAQCSNNLTIIEAAVITPSPTTNAGSGSSSGGICVSGYRLMDGKCIKIADDGEVEDTKPYMKDQEKQPDDFSSSPSGSVISRTKPDEKSSSSWVEIFEKLTDKPLAAYFFAGLVILVASIAAYKVIDGRKLIESKLNKNDHSSKGKAIRELKRAYNISNYKISQLSRYISRESKRGATKKEIVSRLVKNGWNEEIMEDFVSAHQ